MDIPISQQNIISILGIESLPDEQKAALVEKVTVLVQKRLLVKIYDSLDAAKQQEFTALIDQSDTNKVGEFLQANVPDLAGWIEEETNKIKQELKDMAEEMEV